MNTKADRRFALGGADPATRANQPAHQAALALEMQWNALLGQRDLLRDEIKRGNECLERALVELVESRARLEEWPAYERQCGGNCLPCLTEAVSVNLRIRRFLTGWLKRRQGQLVTANQAIDLFGTENGHALRAAACE